jgi:hypothetical protein
MKRSGAAGQRLTAIFMMGCVLLNYPILFLFADAGSVASLPILYVYVFGVWAVLIALMAWVIERRRE